MIRILVRHGAILVAPFVLLVAACGAEPEAPDPDSVCQAFALSHCMTVAATECMGHAEVTGEEIANCPQFVACRESRLGECAAQLAKPAE